MTLLLMVHAASTLAMTGLIWFVQIVHYPLFANVGAAAFAHYEVLHCRRTGFVVMPLMLTEIASAGWLALSPAAANSQWNVYLGLGLLLVIWLSTAALQVPCHRKLEAGFDAVTIRRLVSSNWIRTIAWTARAVLALQLLTATK